MRYNAYASNTANSPYATRNMQPKREAIVEEAKLVTDDVRDIAGGVREGMQLTKQDLQTQTKNWRSAFGARWRSFAQEKEESKGDPPDATKKETDGAGEASASGFQAVRQNIALTADVSKDMWRDVQELRQEPKNAEHAA